jgi:hypothetical protein
VLLDDELLDDELLVDDTLVAEDEPLDDEAPEDPCEPPELPPPRLIELEDAPELSLLEPLDPLPPAAEFPEPRTPEPVDAPSPFDGPEPGDEPELPQPRTTATPAPMIDRMSARGLFRAAKRWAGGIGGVA